MKANWTINRSSYIRNDGTARLYLSAVIDRKRKYYPTAHYLRANQLRRGKVVNHDNADAINADLSHIMTMILMRDIEARHKGSGITHGDISRIMGGDKPSGTMNAFYREHLETSMKATTYTSHKQTLDVLDDHGEMPMPPKYKDIHDWNAYLCDRYESQSTIYKHHKNLKRYINLAIKMDVVQRNPYTGFTVKRPRTDKIKFLNRDELVAVEAAEVGGVERYQVVKDMFLFSCYTALRFSDVSGLHPSAIRDGNLSLERMYKVDRRVFLRLGEMFDGKALDIIRRYPDGFPRLNNAEVNAILKDIARVAKVKPLTFHMARHTFGTLMASRGETIYHIMQWMGISKFETARVYINLGHELG